MKIMYMGPASDTPVFVLRHKATGVLMPDFKGRAGGTFIDPFKPEPGSVPRLFTREKSAGDALRWWAAGKAQPRYGSSFSEFPGDSQTEFLGVKSEPVPGRSAADWEVVPVVFYEARD